MLMRKNLCAPSTPVLAETPFSVANIPFPVDDFFHKRHTIFNTFAKTFRDEGSGHWEGSFQAELFVSC